MEAKEEVRKSLRDIVRESTISLLSAEVRKTRAFESRYRGDGTDLSVVAFGYQVGLFDRGFNKDFENMLKQAYVPVYSQAMTPEDAYQPA